MPAAAVKKKSIFETLNAIDVSDKVEKKKDLTYLSWAWAWGMLKQLYPMSYYTIYEDEHGFNYFTDGNTCWVKTGVTVVDGDEKIEHIEYLPVMNFKNESIKRENVTSCDVNKAIQRSLTKAVARHGLGLYIYAGEDYPESVAVEKKEKENALAAVRTEIANEISARMRLGTEDAMSLDEQRAFAKTYFTPILGNVSYKSCQDMDKLKSLLETLKNIA